MTIFSPGRTIRLKRTLLIRVATGTFPSAAVEWVANKIAPHCIAASQSSTPGTNGKPG